MSVKGAESFLVIKGLYTIIKQVQDSGIAPIHCKRKSRAERGAARKDVFTTILNTVVAP